MAEPRKSVRAQYPRRRRRRGGDRGFLYRLLSLLMLCVCVIGALTMFFRVKSILITGLHRYTDEDIRTAAQLSDGDNLFFLNKYTMIARIETELPYIEEVTITRELPDTIHIDVTECEIPLAVVQDDIAWLIAPGGKIVGRMESADAVREGYGIVSGCELLSPSVGARIALSGEYAVREESLLDLMSALRDSGMTGNVDGIRLDNAAYLNMDYAGRFTVRILYGADYPYKLRALAHYLDSDKIQDNMSGTFDMTRDDKNFFRQNVR